MLNKSGYRRTFATVGRPRSQNLLSVVLSSLASEFRQYSWELGIRYTSLLPWDSVLCFLFTVYKVLCVVEWEEQKFTDQNIFGPAFGGFRGLQGSSLLPYLDSDMAQRSFRPLLRS